MARNTNIRDILFPVIAQPVFLANQKEPIPGFKAITGKVGESLVTFSVVSDNYKLVTNKDALSLGKHIHKQLFPMASSDSFEIFNIIAPETKSFCHIDIIDSNYNINIGKSETYLPFVRIQNSYNRSRILKFDIGFCRKLCDNGVIFEKSFVSLNFTHTEQTFRKLDITTIDVSTLKELENNFIDKVKRSYEIKLPRKYFVPLAAKVLNRNFKTNKNNEYEKQRIHEKLNAFIYSIENYSDKYIKDQELGFTE